MPKVYSSDVSKKGRSFASRTAQVSLVARNGRVLERVRFRGPAGSKRAQEHALQQLIYEQVPDLPEFGAELPSVVNRNLVDYGRFLREDILLLEARSAIRAVQSASQLHQNVRILFLLDSLALVLVLTKYRTLSFLVLVVIRRFYGIAHRANWYLAFRWVPSDVNYSDRELRCHDADYDQFKCLLNGFCALPQYSPSSIAPHETPLSCPVSTSSHPHVPSHLVNSADQCTSSETPISCVAQSSFSLTGRQFVAVC